MADYDDNLLLGYVEGDLTEAERATVEKWIEGDPRLGALLRGMMSDRQALRELPQPDAPAWVLEDVDHGLERSMLLQSHVADHQQVVVRQRHVARRLLTGFAMAAMVLLAASVVIWSIMMTSNPPVRFETTHAQSDQDSYREAITPDGGATEVAIDQPRARSVGKAADADPRTNTFARAPASTQSKAETGTSLLASGKVGGPVNDTVASGMKPGGHDDPMGQTATRTFIGKSAATGEANAAEIAAANADQDNIEVVVQTDNLARTVAQLNDVARNIPNAQLIAEARNLPMPAAVAVASKLADPQVAKAMQSTEPIAVNSPAPADAAPAPAPAIAPQAIVVAQPQQQVDQEAPGQQIAANYQLVVPVDQLQNTLVMLQAPSFNNFTQNVAVRRQSQAGQRQLTQRNAAYWPSRSPDYAAILREQLPASPTTASPAPATSEAVETGPASQHVAEQAMRAEQAPNQQLPAQQEAKMQQQQRGGAADPQATVTVPIVIEMQSTDPQAAHQPADAATLPTPPTTPPAPEAPSPAPNSPGH